MAGDERRTALRYVHTLFEAGSLRGLTDGQLLRRFADRRDGASEAAFALLVERHGGMVLRVSRSILADSHAAEDAFQATFLVLAQKAGSLRVRDSIGPWLHQVAFRVASCARSAASRRRKHESRAAEQKALSTEAASPGNVGLIVHAEVDALPERYRSVVVLCCLEGRTHAEAARHLGCPVGTVQSRLARGRDRLRDRLSRRGLAPSAVLIGVAPAEATLPEALSNSTIRLVSQLIAGRIGPAGMMMGEAFLLCKQVSGDMLMASVRSSLSAFLAVSAIAAVALAFQARGVAEPAAPKAVAKAPEPATQVAEQKNGPKSIAGLLDFGPLHVGGSADASANLVFDEEDEWGEVAVKVTPPRFLKVRDIRLRERTRGAQKTRVVNLMLGVDTSRRGDYSGQVRVEYGGQRVELQVSASVLPAKDQSTKVLVITDGFGAGSRDPGYYRPWFDLVKSASLDVSYLDPSREGLHAGPSEGIDRDGLPVVPDWLKRYDVILLVDGGSCYVQGYDASLLQGYVRGGGRLVVGASSFMLGTVPNANAILARFGLEMTDEDVTRGSAPAGEGWAPFAIRGRIGDEEPLMKGVDNVVFRRATPVRATKGGRGRILLPDPEDEGRGFAAVSRDGGEIVALGPSLFFTWVGEKENGAENVALLRNLLTKSPTR